MDLLDQRTPLRFRGVSCVSGGFGRMTSHVLCFPDSGVNVGSNVAEESFWFLSLAIFTDLFRIF